MGLDVQGLMHVGYRIGAQADQVPAIVAFYKSVFDLDIDSNRPTIPNIPGAWVQLPNSSVKPQFHLMVAPGYRLLRAVRVRILHALILHWS